MTDRSNAAHGNSGTMVLVLAAVSLLMSWACGPSQEQRCVFIDAGAHFGESYTAFQKSNLYSRYSWDIFAIEANPRLIDGLPPAANLTVLNKAVWVSDGTIEFHMESDTSGANTVMGDFKGTAETISVESFDFSQWLKQNFSEDDYVILSLDIEGAEYQVLDKLLKDETIKYLDRLYVELHPYLLEGVPRRQADKRGRLLLREISKLKIMVGDDSVEDIMRRGDWLDFLL